MLYDKPKACTVTVLIDTPPELIGDEDPAPHRVSHIPETERILTGNEVERDADKEQQIIEAPATGWRNTRANYRKPKP